MTTTTDTAYTVTFSHPTDRVRQPGAEIPMLASIRRDGARWVAAYGSHSGGVPLGSRAFDHESDAREYLEGLGYEIDRVTGLRIAGLLLASAECLLDGRRVTASEEHGRLVVRDFSTTEVVELDEIPEEIVDLVARARAQRVEANADLYREAEAAGELASQRGLVHEPIHPDLLTTEPEGAA